MAGTEIRHMSNSEIEKSWIKVLEAAKGHHEELLGAELIGEMRLTVQARQAAVVRLHDKGLSQRQIATVVGASQKTISNDLREENYSKSEENYSPDPISKSVHRALADDRKEIAGATRRVCEMFNGFTSSLKHLDIQLAIEGMDQKKRSDIYNKAAKMRRWCWALMQKLEKENDS